MKSNPFYDAYRVLNKIYAQGAHLKIALSEVDLEPSNRAHTVKTVYGVLENDGYLSLAIKTFAQKSPKQPVRILLKISLYHLIFLKKPRYMVTDTAVDLLKRMGKGGMGGFVNAFLRSFDEEKIVLPEGDEKLALLSNFPLFAVKKIRAQYGERAESILLARSRGVSVRFLRGEEEYLTLPHENTPFEKVFLFPNFTRDENFFKGNYTFQSVGSVAICGCIDPCDKLLDACAAPGGKSVLLSEKCREVYAAEVYPHRAELIGSYAKRMNVQNIQIFEEDSSVYRPEWESFFDGVLCDVPCTGLGTVAENPDLPLRKKEEDFPALLKIQRAILSNCARYVKPGGTLYYSTCSILEEENDGAAEDFLKENKEFSGLPLTSPLPHEKTKCGIQFLPDRAFGAGFFVAKMRRV